MSRAAQGFIAVLLTAGICLVAATAIPPGVTVLIPLLVLAQAVRRKVFTLTDEGRELKQLDKEFKREVHLLTER